jgi:cytoskeletal protein CcmA (bactofilin family)
VVFQQAFEGELEIQGRLTIDPSAAVKGMFRSEEIHVRGAVEGSLEGTRMVTLETSARVDGDVTTPRLQMVTGAYLNGNITMAAPQASLKRQRT